MPCYFGTTQNPKHAGQSWSDVTGDKYVASPGNLGSGAPQGVRGSTQALLDGKLLKQLKSLIKSTGGSYTVR